ncbi:FecR family protein [Steroidobacter sp.]|uniref:FecR family protein n=1 Tax=Steroidobacter sp. TaxID=1978227 RepID=UPI001A51AC18|nr:FecR domain-containing protein [Steroidobacter sp.]MBL8268734.1 FecR domain-containing protein [Steroidobacter sp.]
MITATDRVQQASQWCLRLAEGDLSVEARRDFDVWTADPENALAFEDAARVWQALERSHLSPQLIEMRRSALDKLRRAEAASWSRGTSHRWRYVSIAASLVVILIGAALWVRFAPVTYVTGIGERQVIALADGSMLTLDAQSEVAVRYNGNRRDLSLRRGRAKFQVAKDPLRPFSVSAADKMVVATGTQFSVELLSRKVRVVLYEGAVEVLATETLQPVTITAATRHQRDPGLLPGRELIAPTEQAVAQTQPVDLLRAASWEAGQVAFNDEPLATAVERMNRYTNVPLEIGDEQAATVRISGVFAAGEPEAFIEGVTGVFPVRVDEVAGRRVFRSTR